MGSRSTDRWPTEQGPSTLNQRELPGQGDLSRLGQAARSPGNPKEPAVKRRTLDILFSIGGVGVALLLAVAGIVLTANANFANTYVKDQLSQQKISFKPAAALTTEERQADCLVKNGGKQLTTGKQAECYANEFIGLHVRESTDGRTYAELGTPQTELRTKVAEAKKTNDPGLVDLEKQLTEISATRESAFKGETLRGLLLTSYGFSEFGTKASQAATVAYMGSLLMALLAAAGLVHAFRTSKSAAFAPPESAPQARQYV
jgi:hypothetical protein